MSHLPTSSFHLPIHFIRHINESECLRTVHTLRWIFLSEDFQFRMFIDTKIQLPILTLWTVVFSDNREAQLVHIEIL